jgi:hypothetical protein
MTTNFGPGGIDAASIPGMLGLPYVRKVLYCDVAGIAERTGNGNTFATLADAYAAADSGKNDVIVLIGDGGTAASVRLSANFAWAKSAVHLLGACSPVHVSQRARIAPTSGATAFANFFTVSGNGCIFKDIQFFHGFTTGTAAQIALTVTGSRNAFLNCHIGGMGDQESADDAGSRSLKVGGSGAGENLFHNCVIGLDTITRGAANASVEFVGATPRNRFSDCIFPFQTDAATPLGIIGSASGCMDRWQLFERCKFINNIKSTSTTMTALATLAASAGGLILFDECAAVGITDYGSDATTFAQMFIMGPVPTAATSGLAVATA